MNENNNPTTQSPAYHGIQNVKYVRCADKNKTMKEIPHALSINFDPQLEEVEVFASNKKVLGIPSDNGYKGNLGVTAPDPDLELDVKHTMKVKGATADVNQTSYERVNFYYEYKAFTEKGVEYTAKVWALNNEVAKASKSHKTDAKSIELGEYQYPITTYGVPVLSDDKTPYKDENGNQFNATRLVSVPGDDGYKTFENEVPEVIRESETSESSEPQEDTEQSDD